MPITRAKASQLLNQREMALYDESRINGLRQLDGKALATRVTRARTARDRARDLVRRQKLASRSSTGSKRGPGGTDNQRSKDKAELMADILARFETRQREVDRQEARSARTAASAAGRKTAGKAGAQAAAGARAPRKAAGAGKGSSATATSKSPAQATKQAAVAAPAAPRSARETANTDDAAPASTSARRNGGLAAGPGKGSSATTSKSPAAATKQAAAAAPAAPRSARETADTDDAAPASTSARRNGGLAAGPGKPRATARTDGADGASTAGDGARRDGRATTAPARRPRKRRLTPEQALAQTQALLEAKQARDAEPKPWADIGGEGADAGAVGYQSPGAARRADQLHAGEMRLPANQGSISTRDRVNQGKRDHRGRVDD